MKSMAKYIALGFRELRRTMNEGVAAFHGERIAARARINGQPNGYRPITEADLQDLKRLARELDKKADTKKAA